MLTAYDVQSHHVRAVRVGAAGYLSKLSDVHTIASAIRRIHAGHRAFSTEVLRSASQAPVAPTARELRDEPGMGPLLGVLTRGCNARRRVILPA